jgi:rubrerythrin
LEDEEFEEWTQQWKTIDKDQKLTHIQTFFRMLLSDDSITFYYSFCRDDLIEEDCGWHCQKCQTCRDWREWHCPQCDKCNELFHLY